MTDPSRPLVGIPVKPFGVAKQRLHPMLSASTRSSLGRAIAERTARTAMAAGADVAIVTGDIGVTRWANELGLTAVAEFAGGLDGAAQALRAHADATDRAWVLVHADLPLIAVKEVAELLEGLAGGSVIAPSHDGGTTAIGTDQPLAFRYGPASFRQHLAQIPESAVLVRPGLAFDLDTVADLAQIRSHRRGRWVEAHIDAIGSPL